MVRNALLTFILLNSFIGFTQMNVPSIIKFETLDKLMKDNRNIRVINFWATWCAPCVKELPYFEKAALFYEGTNVEIILVSLDFANQLDKVERFIERKNIKSKVLLLDETDYNTWIDKVSKEWSGALPATLVIDTKNIKYFKEGEIQEAELFDLINIHIK